jgi:hypothetical protein
MQPAQKQNKLYTGGNDGGQNGVPVGGHGGRWEIKEVRR